MASCVSGIPVAYKSRMPVRISSAYKFGFKAAIALLAFALPMSVHAQGKGAACRAILDKSSTPNPRVIRQLPDGFKLFVWRYNSHLTKRDGATSFDNGQVSQLDFEAHSGTYYSRGTEGVRDNELEETPESRHYRLDGGALGVIPNTVRAELNSGSEGEGIFERNQAFTFGIYSKLGYLTPEEAALQKSIARNFLKPEQVTFVEATEVRDTKSLKKEFNGKIPPHARLEPQSAAWQEYRSHFSDYKRPRNRTYDLKVGASWLISGQVDGKRLPLALEAEELATPIDRSQHKFIFELGRAGQEKNYGFEETLRANLFYALTEVLAAGGRPEDAYIFAHAMDQARSIVFRRTYHMKEFSKYKDPTRSAETVMMVPLSRLLAEFDPGEFSYEINKIREELPMANKIPSAKLYRWILDSRQLANQTLVAKLTTTERLKLQIRDFSNLRAGFFEAKKSLSRLSDDVREGLAQKMNSSEPPMEDRDNIAAALERDYNSPAARMSRLSGIVRRHPRYQKEGLQGVKEFLWQENAIEIFPEVQPGALSRSAAEEVLIGVYDHYLALLKKSGVADPHEFLRSRGVRFALTVDSTRFRQVLEQTEAKGFWYVHRPSITYTEQFGLGFGFGGFSSVRQTEEILWSSWSYDADQVSEIRQARLAGGQSLPGVHRERRHATRLLKDLRLLDP